MILKTFHIPFIELPKFKKDIEELESGIERWCYFFKHACKPEDANKMLEYTKDNIMEDAYGVLEAHNWTRKELMQYEGY